LSIPARIRDPPRDHPEQARQVLVALAPMPVAVPVADLHSVAMPAACASCESDEVSRFEFTNFWFA
jgi:hypothetical protein